MDLFRMTLFQEQVTSAPRKHAAGREEKTGAVHKIRKT